MTRAPLGLPDGVWPFFYALLALVACWLVSPLDVPLVADNQHYFFISERFASGVPPHISHFDPKNALSMMLSGAAIALGRLFGIADIYSARALSIFVTAACYGMLWIVALGYSRSRAVAHLSVLGALSFNQFIIMGAMGARPKVFMVLFVLCVLWGVQARRPILTGLAAAAAFLCWQPALLFAGLVPLPLLFWERPFKSTAYFVLGFLALAGLYESYFIYHGAFYEQIEQAYLFPSQYMSGIEMKLAPMRMRFGWVTKTKEGVNLRSIVSLSGVLFVSAASVWSLLRPRRAFELLRARPEWGYFLAVSGAGLVFLHLDYQGFPDRFIVDPMLAIGFGMLFCFPLLLAEPGSRGRPVAHLSVVAAIALQLWTIPQLELADYRGPILKRQTAMGEELGKLIADGNTVWAIGCTHLLAFAKHDNWVPYGFFFRGTDRYLSRRYGDPYIPYRDGELPDVILLSRGKLGGLETWLPRFYERETETEYSRNSIAFWTKREVPIEPSARRSYDSLRKPVRKSKNPLLPTAQSR